MTFNPINPNAMTLALPSSHLPLVYRHPNSALVTQLSYIDDPPKDKKI